MLDWLLLPLVCLRNRVARLRVVGSTNTSDAYFCWAINHSPQLPPPWRAARQGTALGPRLPCVAPSLASPAYCLCRGRGASSSSLSWPDKQKRPNDSLSIYWYLWGSAQHGGLPEGLAMEVRIGLPSFDWVNNVSRFCCHKKCTGSSLTFLHWPVLSPAWETASTALEPFRLSFLTDTFTRPLCSSAERDCTRFLREFWWATNSHGEFFWKWLLFQNDFKVLQKYVTEARHRGNHTWYYCTW